MPMSLSLPRRVQSRSSQVPKHWLDTIALAVAILPACACGGITAAQTRSPAARTSPFRVAAVDQSLITTTIYVEQGANNASPSQTIRSQPTFRTVSAAVQFANILTHRGIGTKVVIRPG